MSEKNDARELCIILL